MTTNQDWLFSLPLEEQYAWMNAEHDKWIYNERITNQAEMLHMPESHESANPDCSAMLYKTFTGNMCSHYEPKDGVVAILREAARNLSDYHDAGEALRRLTDTTNVYHALETLADMIERDYVRRESIEEVMDNDRALVEENSMLAGELLKLRAEIEKATNNLNSANEDFENARADLAAERDELQSKLAEYEDRSMQFASLTGGTLYVGTKALTERIAELTAEQVRDVIERHSMWVNGNNRCFHNGAYEDIADELNAELGSSILYGREQIEALEAKWKAEDGTCEVRDD